MTIRTLTIATTIALLAACGPAHAGLNAMFGGVRAAVSDAATAASRSSERRLPPASAVEAAPQIDVFDV